MIIAYCRVHYGLDYLPSVIRSVLPYVDHFIVLYTPVPTFGYPTALVCPDSREALKNAVLAAGAEWYEGLPMEGETAWNLYPDTELAFELDSDEVIHPALAEQIVQDYRDGKLTEHAYRLPFMHMWRSFGYGCIHTDSQTGAEDPLAWPVRLYQPQKPKLAPVPYPNPAGRIYHFGYCRSETDMRYKWTISAHSVEIRADWWQTWNGFPDRLTDLHPVGVNVWNAVPIDRITLPPVLRDHVYYNRGKVE